MKSRRIAVQLVRLGIIVAAVALLRVGRAEHAAISPDEARAVLGADADAFELVLRTAPETDDLIGYAGPSDVLIALDRDGSVARVRLRSSADTVAHVDAIRQAAEFWRQFEGWAPAGNEPLSVDAVSGSTLTSFVIGESVERRLTGRARSWRFPDPVELDDVRALFSGATALESGDPMRVLDADGRVLGFVVRTSPVSDNVIGYAGPTDALVGLAPDRARIVGVRLRDSYDTPSYVDRVRAGDDFLRQLAAQSVSEWRAIDFAAAGIEGVSGATQTSFAVAEGIRRRLAKDDRSTGSVRVRDVSLLLILAGSLALTFGRWRGSRIVRRVWQLVLVGGLGIALGDLLSISLVTGWAQHGAPWSAAPALVALVAIALLVPWSSRRQLYCASLCPHGAVQEWVSSVRRFRWRLPRRAHRWLSAIPGASLVVVCVVALALPSFDLAAAEPFDAWSIGIAASISLALAIAGVAACLFVPMAYCRFGCPTGALLKFVRAGGARDRIGRWDVVALVLLVVCLPLSRLGAGGDPGSPEFSGFAFGTSWSLDLGNTPPTDALRDRVIGELERIEREFSTRNPDSEVANFNGSSTTLPIEVSAELSVLVERSKRSDLVLDPTHGTLQKVDPRMRLDLDAELPRYAAEHVAGILDDHGVETYEVRIGSWLIRSLAQDG